MGPREKVGTEDGSERSEPRAFRHSETRTKIEVTEEQKKIVAKAAKAAYSSVNSFIKKLALEEVNRMTSDLPDVPDDILPLIQKERPEAIVYTAPVVGAKIIASPSEDGWKGVAFHPEYKGSLFAWTSDNLNLPGWARSNKVVKSMLLIASRVDDNGMSHFRVPNSKFVISAEWSNDRWERGYITNTETKVRQPWERGGWYSNMYPGPFNLSPELRRLMNMLTRALTVKNEGLTTKVPLS